MERTIRITVNSFNALDSTWITMITSMSVITKLSILMSTTQFSAVITSSQTGPSKSTWICSVSPRTKTKTKKTTILTLRTIMRVLVGFKLLRPLL